MKIRLEGTEPEIKRFLVNNIRLEGKIFKSISKFYPNRNTAEKFLNRSNETGRIYIEIG